MAKKIVTEVAPRTVYTSPCGRARVELHGRREYLALLDDQPCGFHEFAFQAEHAAGAALTEALEREAVWRADEAAERDAEAAVTVEPVLLEAEFSGEGPAELAGLDFTAGETTIHISSRSEPHEREPQVFHQDMAGALPFSTFERIVREAGRILADPRFQQARAAKAEGSPLLRLAELVDAYIERQSLAASGSPLALPPSAETEDAERGVIYADAGPLQIGVDSESVLLTLELPLDALRAMRVLCDTPAVARLLRVA